MPDLPATLLPALLKLLPSGVVYYTPCYDAAGAVVDFAFAYLNPAAQQQLGLPAQPTVTYLQQWPGSVASGAFAFHRDTFLAGTSDSFEQFYQADNYTFSIQAHACRAEEGLLVTFADVTKQPRLVVEETLRRSHTRARAARSEAELQRQQLYAMFEQAPAMICIFNGPQHVFQFVNPPYQALVGDRPLVGKPIAQAMPELAGQPIFGLLDRVYQTGEPFHAAEMLVQLDHHNEGRQQLEERYYNFVYQARRDAAGVIDGILVFAYDVTAQAQARQQVQALNQELAALNEALEARVQERTRQLEQQQLLLSQILGQVPAFIATFSGPDHRFTFFNEPYQRLATGRAQLGLAAADALPEAREQGFINLLDQVYASGQPFVGREAAFTTAPDATQYYLDFTYQPLLDKLGRVHGILAFAVEVTQQVLAQRQREAQQRLVTTLFEQAPTAIWVTQGPDYVFELLNPFMGQLLGRSPAQAIGRPYFDVMPELATQGLPDLLRQAWQSGEPVVVQELPARLAHHAAGEIGYFTFVFQALRDEHDQVTRIACVAVEVTEQVLARQQVQRLNEALTLANEELHGSNARLTRTNADLDTFVYTASHDLKSPITNIEGLLTELRHQLPPAARQANLVPQLLDMMEGAVHRFQETLGHLADVARLQDDLVSQVFEPVDLPTTLEAVRLDMLPELTAAEATLTVDLGECPPLRLTAKTLRSIFYNLLSNAVKYRAPGRAPLVQVRCRPAEPGHLAIDVQDNGLGLAPPQQSSLFQLFHRLHTHVAGSGVGLYMVKRLVDNAGGTIRVQSELGVGSTFTVTLPAGHTL